MNAILSGRRGQILGFDTREGWEGWDTVRAQMPESEIGDLIIEVRSATAGVGSFIVQVRSHGGADWPHWPIRSLRQGERPSRARSHLRDVNRRASCDRSPGAAPVRTVLANKRAHACGCFDNFSRF